MTNLKKASYLSDLLDLKYAPIAFKFLKTKEDFDSFQAQTVKHKTTYCTLLKKSMTKGPIKATVKNLTCFGAARSLGLIEIPEEFKSGVYGFKMNIYKDVKISKFVASKVVNVKELYHGFAVGPLADFSHDADVVILLTSPYQAMRVAQSYTYGFGIKADFKMSGNQAFCSELTATPFLNKNINFSMLCSGTRFMAKWDDNTMGVGMHGEFAEKIIDGILGTLNSIEPNAKKKKIMENLAARRATLEEMDIKMDDNYYLNIYTLNSSKSAKSDSNCSTCKS